MKPKRKRIVQIVFFTLIALSLIGALAYKAYAPTGDVILIRSSSGGLCLAPGEIAGHECTGQTKLYANGNFGKTHLSHRQITELQKLITQTDLNSYTTKSPRGSACPSAVDGSDVGYSFPAKTGAKLYTVCRLNIPANDPLFSYLAALKSE